MAHNPYVTVHVDLNRICENAQQIRAQTRVPVLAVVKSDAYGLGAQNVAEALGEIVEGFCVLSLQEAIDAQIYRRTSTQTLALGPPTSMNPADYRAAGVTPAISTLEHAVLLKAAKPALCVDTGMQRFACPREHVNAVFRAGNCREAFTHATRLEHAQLLKEICGPHDVPLHAASSSLLNEPAALLDAVRPGLALYRGAARVATTLVEARDASGPAGYGGFITARFGVILAGYSHGVRVGPCTVNGEPRRLLEVGMQSSFVEIGPNDRVGDEVALLDETANEKAIAEAWGVTPQHALFALCSAGRKVYED